VGQLQNKALWKAMLARHKPAAESNSPRRRRE
jgi:hypothetical protein